MGKLCERPGRSDVVAMGYESSTSNRLLVWLACPRSGRRSRSCRLAAASATPMRCRASRLDAPRPLRVGARLFRPKADEAATPLPPRRRPRRRRRPSRRRRWSAGAAADAHRAGHRAGSRRCSYVLDEARTVAEVTGSHRPSTTRTPPRRSRGSDVRRARDLDALLSTAARRSPGRSRAPTASADADDRLALHRRRLPPTTSSSSLATLDRYPAWMRLVHRAEALPRDDGRRPGGSSRAAGSARSPARSSCGWCAPCTSRRTGALRARARTTTATMRRGSSRPTVDAVDGGRQGRRPSSPTAASSGARACWSGCSKTRSAGARPR